tara:strand:- start:43148 stop:43681 length:534 start_codon:yes stop_codon:yes gene_type:complete
MVNASKAKGDRAELEAVRAITELCPDLIVWNAQRMLGAGRKEDIGDLLVFPDAAVQVKAFKATALSAGLYSAAAGATEQAARARHPFALGLVLVPRARLVGSVRWAASVDVWPTERAHEIASSSIAALDAVKVAGPDVEFTAKVQRKNAAPIIVGSLQTWVRDYRLATGRPVPEESI